MPVETFTTSGRLEQMFLFITDFLEIGVRVNFLLFSGRVDCILKEHDMFLCISSSNLMHIQKKHNANIARALGSFTNNPDVERHLCSCQTGTNFVSHDFQDHCGTGIQANVCSFLNLSKRNSANGWYLFRRVQNMRNSVSPRSRCFLTGEVSDTSLSRFCRNFRFRFVLLVTTPPETFYVQAMLPVFQQQFSSVRFSFFPESCLV